MKAQHKIFAAEIAKGLKTSDAYKIAYPNAKSNDGAGSAGRRLLKQDDVKNEIARVKSELVTLHEQSVKEQIQKAGGRALTWAMKRALLHDIANGKKIKIGTKAGKPVYKVPTATEQIRAIELDNEMTGEGWRPPEPPAKDEGSSGNTFNGPVYNQIIRKTVFKTRETTARGQTFQITANEQSEESNS